MTAAEFESRIVAWAQKEKGLDAVVLGGSRAIPDDRTDYLSDWDIQLITDRPRDYQGTGWLKNIAPCWCANVERTPRGVMKVSAVFEGGLEVDFVPLATWQMKLVYACMRYPQWAGIMPKQLQRGIQETRGFMLGSGYRLLGGNSAWEERFEALKVDWPERMLSPEEFDRHIAAFWPKAVWIYKKIARPEPRSAMHWLHLLVVQHVYVLLAEEARLRGRIARPEARKAEQWLDDRRLAQTAIVTSTDQRQLAHALLAVMNLFCEVARNIAESRGFVMAEHAAVESWLRTELSKIENRPISSPPAGTPA